MTYPTMEQVEVASKEQLARWYRFLPSPGEAAIGKSNAEFHKELTEQSTILTRIDERFKAEGFFTPELSKRIGWNNYD